MAPLGADIGLCRSGQPRQVWRRPHSRAVPTARALGDGAWAIMRERQWSACRARLVSLMHVDGSYGPGTAGLARCSGDRVLVGPVYRLGRVLSVLVSLGMDSESGPSSVPLGGLALLVLCSAGLGPGADRLRALLGVGPVPVLRSAQVARDLVGVLPFGVGRGPALGPAWRGSSTWLLLCRLGGIRYLIVLRPLEAEWLDQRPGNWAAWGLSSGISSSGRIRRSWPWTTM